MKRYNGNYIWTWKSLETDRRQSEKESEVDVLLCTNLRCGCLYRGEKESERERGEKERE